jgi:hypothetical protein
MPFQTEFEFTLPKGYVDDGGTLHRQGVMRLATAADEVLPLKDPRVQSNSAYLIIILLSRVITRLGSLSDVSTHIVEKMFASDVSFLQELYNKINGNGSTLIDAVCPKCEHKFNLEMVPSGE